MTTPKMIRSYLKLEIEIEIFQVKLAFGQQDRKKNHKKGTLRFYCGIF